MTGADTGPSAEAGTRGLATLVPVLAAEFPRYSFRILQTWNGPSLSASDKDHAGKPGLYAVITSDPDEMRRVLSDSGYPGLTPRARGQHRP